MPTAGTILSRTFSMFVAGFLPFNTISFLIHSPLIAFDVFLYFADGTSVELLVIGTWGSTLLLTPIATAALVYGVFRSMRGQIVTTSECIRVGVSRWLGVVLLSLLLAIATFVGYMLCIAPGVIVTCGMFVAVPALMVEELNAFDATQRSWALTDGYKLAVFGVVLVLGVIGFGVTVIAQLLDLGLVGANVVAQIAQHLVSIPLTTLQAIAAGIAYYQIRLFREGLDEDELAAVFD
ncbi:MAG: hypothetical protein GY719_26620 [bacterium]|nr:hypothetical protein [bacterium]